MRWIQKGPEPRSLAQYKNSPNASWDNLPTDIKDNIREKLKAEQGHLCAYCMRRIQWVRAEFVKDKADYDRRQMKIEHWTPRNKLDEAGKLDFQNMLGVCLGHSNGAEDTCDTRKGSAEITVDPRKKEHIDMIFYDITPDRVLIQSEGDIFKEDIERRLNLNEELLSKDRKSFLDELIDKLASAGTGMTTELYEKNPSLHSVDKKSLYFCRKSPYLTQFRQK